jgi:RNA polymerase sigma factor (TIGR02999 family)
MSDVSRILSQIDQGDPQAAEKLLPLVYDELRKLAAAKLAQEKPGQTLQATALVHDAYIRLVDTEKAQHWESRRHFFAVAAESMRRILVENARRKTRLKRGGSLRRESIELDGVVAEFPDDELLALHEALEQLSVHDPVKARLVELRFFGGMTVPEIAETLGISLSTAERDWRYARAWLYAAMEGEQNKSQPG